VIIINRKNAVDSQKVSQPPQRYFARHKLQRTIWYGAFFRYTPPLSKISCGNFGGGPCATRVAKNAKAFFGLKNTYFDKMQNTNQNLRPAITFVELLIVIIIIGILSAVSIPNFKKSFEKFALDSFVKDLYCLNCYLKQSAISQGKIYCLNISRDSKPPQLYATYKKNDGFERMKGRFGKLYKLPKEVNIFSIEPQDRLNIYFYPDGSVDNVTFIFKNKFKEEASLSIKGANGVIQIK
jgi:type II secretory pathway pseudopilin PulG